MKVQGKCYFYRPLLGGPWWRYFHHGHDAAGIEGGFQTKARQCLERHAPLEFTWLTQDL